MFVSSEIVSAPRTSGVFVLPQTIGGTDPWNYCFECLGTDHEADGVKKASTSSVEKAAALGSLSLLTHQVSLRRERGEVAADDDYIPTAFHHCCLSSWQRWRFRSQRKTTASPQCLGRVEVKCGSRHVPLPLPLVHPQKGSNGTRRKNATARRSKHCRHRAMVTQI